MDYIEGNVLQEHTDEISCSTQYDVAIVGGGLAGLTLALQLKKARPATSILVVEKQKHPVPEAAHKVGESSVEIGASYLRDTLGLQEHLENEQLIKYALRFFFSTDDNRDITKRVEFGLIGPPAIHSYQLDRGRLENMLSDKLAQQGIVWLDGCKVQQIALQPQSSFHHLHIVGAECGEREIQACWVVDASGRSSLLKRQLGLSKKVSHAANAVWFRVAHPIKVDDWSTDPAWQAHVIDGKRWLSTNHLMGPGYWVWLIPLASGSTSIGIVTDPSIQPFEEMNNFERAMAWLHAHEPQCAEIVEQHRDKIQDFRVMKDYSYSCEQVYSDERWCLTGEAGIFVDPLYSPGSDMIAISNGLICDLITRNLDGEEIEEQAAIHNKLFLLLTESWLTIYERQYALMDNAQIMITKVAWDMASYWAIPALIYFHDKFQSVIDVPGALMHFVRYTDLNNRFQTFLLEWHAMDKPVAIDTFIGYPDFPFLLKLLLGLKEDLSDVELAARLTANVRFMEQLTGQLISMVIQACIDRTEDEVIQTQIQRWQTDPFLTELIAIYQEEQKVNPITSTWITLEPHRDSNFDLSGSQLEVLG